MQGNTAGEEKGGATVVAVLTLIMVVIAIAALGFLMFGRTTGEPSKIEFNEINTRPLNPPTPATPPLEKPMPMPNPNP